MSGCKTNSFITCNEILATHEIHQSSCLKALFFNLVPEVHELCHFELHLHLPPTPLVTAIHNHKLLIVSQAASWVMTCRGKQPKSLTASHFCVISLPCFCDLKGFHSLTNPLSQHAYSDLYIPGSLSQCDPFLTTVKIEYAINLALAWSLFNNSLFSDLSASHLLTTPPLISLPDLNTTFRDASWQHILGAESKFKINLNRVAKHLSATHLESFTLSVPHTSFLQDPFFREAEKYLFYINFVGLLFCMFAIYMLCGQYRRLALYAHLAPKGVLCNPITLPTFKLPPRPTLVVYPSSVDHTFIQLLLLLFLIYIAFKFIKMLAKWCGLISKFKKVTLCHSFKINNVASTTLVIELSSSTTLYHIPVQTFPYPPAHFVGISYVSPASISVKRHFLRPHLLVNWGSVTVMVLHKKYDDLNLPTAIPISLFQQ